MCVFSVQWARSSEQWAVFIVQWAEFSMHWILCIEQRALCNVQCVFCIVHCVVWIVLCAVCSLQCVVCSLHCAVCSVQCIVCSVQCAMFLRLDSYHYSVKDSLTCTARLHCTTFFVTMQDICGCTVQYCTVLHCCTVLNSTLLHFNMHITALQYYRVYARWRKLCRDIFSYKFTIAMDKTRADTAQTNGPPSP